MAHSQALLQITAPVSNSVVTEGQTVTITVSADPSVQVLGVITQSPLPEVQSTSSSTQFTLTVPATVPPGLYNLTAIGTNAAGAVNSLPVAVDVERQYAPVGIAAGPTSLYLKSVGDQFPLQVIGTFSDGSTLDVTHSTLMTYTSNNTQVASVNSSGMVTAVGPGQTTILVRAGVVLGYSYDGIMVQIPQQPSSAPAPVVTSVSPTTGIPGTTQITVSGSGFGATQGTGFVQLGSQDGVVSSWSDTQVVWNQVRERRCSSEWPAQ